MEIERDILSECLGRVITASFLTKYVFISTQAATWTLADLCRVLGVSCGGYYQWLVASLSPVPSWQSAAQ